MARCFIMVRITTQTKENHKLGVSKCVKAIQEYLEKNVKSSEIRLERIV